jgi:glycerate 2-kinase
LRNTFLVVCWLGVYIKNLRELVDHGELQLREQLATAIEAALESVDPYRLTRDLVRLQGNTLTIGNLQFDLTKLSRVVIIGAGKATYPTAKALEEILGNRISSGLIIVKGDENRTLSKIGVVQAGHPIPDEAGFRAAQEIVRLASGSDKNDLFLAAFSGGCSALMPYPLEGISLEDEQETTRLLLRSGATIREINAVRKHISRTKGGGLARMMAPATTVNLTVSDVIGDPLDCITDPTVVDSSTFSDAITALKKHELWDLVPESVRNHLENGSPKRETLKEYGNLRVHNFILANNVMAAEAAHKSLTNMGFNSQILTTSLEGESREVGYVLAGIVSETVRYDRPLKKPAAYVCAGETLVKLEHGTQEGMGGPSQELALATAIRLPSNSESAGIFLDTDGSDGPTDLAGAMIDSRTRDRAEKVDVNLTLALKEHDTGTALLKLSDAVRTGATGTNVMDLAILAVAH